MNVLSKFLKKPPHFAKKTVLKKEIIDEVANRIHPLHPLTFDEILQTVDFENRASIILNHLLNSIKFALPIFVVIVKVKEHFNKIGEIVFSRKELMNFAAIKYSQTSTIEVDYLKSIIEISDGGYENLLYDFVTEQGKNISEKQSNFMNEFMDQIIYSFFIENDSYTLIHDYTNFAESERRVLYYNKEAFIRDELITFATVFEDALFFLSNNFSAFSKIKLELIRPDLFEKQ